MKTRRHFALAVLLVFTLGIAAAPLTAQAAGVDVTSKFTDPNFLAAVREELGLGANAPIYDTVCAAVTDYLNVDSKNIKNLAGLEYFTNLYGFSCYDNQLTTLPTLPNYLYELDCSSNQLKTLPTLPAGLWYLTCNNNQLISLPALPAGLLGLECWGNQLKTLPELPITLRELDCFYNQLTTLPMLPASLTTLYCYCNQLTTLPELPNNLYDFACSNNQLTTLPELPANLQYLHCQNNQLTTLPALPANLIKLDCGNNRLTTLPPLPTTLRNLYCQNNQLTKLPALPINLIKLYCSHNQLTAIDINDLNRLLEFNCSYNNLKNINAVSGYSNGLQTKTINGDRRQFKFFPQNNPVIIWPNPFVDIKQSDWFYNDVGFGYINSVFSGINSKTFAPNLTLTRAMAVTVLYRYNGLVLHYDYYELPFIDVLNGEWYTDAVKWTIDCSIVTGTSPTTFNPNIPATREQLAVMIWRYANFYHGYRLPNTVPAKTFADQKSISPWALDAVTALQKQGIINGKPGNKFDPQGKVTRAEAAAMFSRLQTALG